jgi:hypothetical protein
MELILRQPGLTLVILLLGSGFKGVRVVETLTSS